MLNQYLTNLGFNFNSKQLFQNKISQINICNNIEHQLYLKNLLKITLCLDNDWDILYILFPYSFLEHLFSEIIIFFLLTLNMTLFPFINLLVKENIIEFYLNLYLKNGNNLTIFNNLKSNYLNFDRIIDIIENDDYLCFHLLDNFFFYLSKKYYTLINNSYNLFKH